jgi:ribosomal protein L30E
VLQLMIWMMAFYMALKAVELILIARNSPEDRRETSVSIATLAGVLAIIAAVVFVYLANKQVEAMPPPIF